MYQIAVEINDTLKNLINFEEILNDLKGIYADSKYLIFNPQFGMKKAGYAESLKKENLVTTLYVVGE